MSAADLTMNAVMHENVSFDERILNVTELDEYAEGFKKVALVTAGFMQTLDAIAPLSHSSSSVLKDLNGLTEILSALNMCALYDWWVYGKRESSEHTNFMALSTVLQTALTAKFLAGVTQVTADKMEWISNTLGNIPVIGQGLGILECAAYGYNAVYHVKKYRANEAEKSEFQATVAKVQAQLSVIERFSKDVDVQSAIEKELPEEAEVTKHLMDNDIKLQYLQARLGSRITVLNRDIENLDISQNMLRMSLVNDISHIAYGILAIVASALLLAGSSAAVVVSGVPLALCSFVACSISLSKLLYHKHCEKKMSRKLVLEVPPIVKMAIEAQKNKMLIKVQQS